MNEDEVKLFLVKVKKKGFSSNSSEKKEAYSADSKVTSKLITINIMTKMGSLR